MGVVSRNCMWLECMGVASGCGCKEVYRLTSLLLLYVLFCSSIIIGANLSETHLVGTMISLLV